jgi:hypothetical protein
MKRWMAAVALTGACTMGQQSAAPRTPETARQCSDTCTAMGLKMQAVVIVAGKSGCVCEPTDAAVPHAAGGPAAVQSAILAVDEESTASMSQEQLLQEQQRQQAQEPK